MEDVRQLQTLQSPQEYADPSVREMHRHRQRTQLQLGLHGMGRDRGGKTAFGLKLHMEPRLDVCPVCQGQAYIIQDKGTYRIEHDSPDGVNCILTTLIIPSECTLKDAVKIWNGLEYNK